MTYRFMNIVIEYYFNLFFFFANPQSSKCATACADEDNLLIDGMLCLRDVTSNKIKHNKTNDPQGIFSSMSQPNEKPPTIIHTRDQSNESSSATIEIVYRIHSRNTDHLHQHHINNHYENNSIFPISMRIWYHHVITNSSIIIFIDIFIH